MIEIFITFFLVIQQNTFKIKTNNPYKNSEIKSYERIFNKENENLNKEKTTKVIENVYHPYQRPIVINNHHHPYHHHTPCAVRILF